MTSIFLLVNPVFCVPVRADAKKFGDTPEGLA